MSFSAIDLLGFKLRTVMPDSDVAALEGKNPGWLQQNLNSWTSRIYAQLRKRYGNGAPGAGDSLPLGQQPPALEAQGTLPPALTLTGRPVLGSMIVLVKVPTPGPLGTAAIAWSRDNGVIWSPPIVSAASIVLTGTGLTLVMASDTYSADNTYAAATPIPETVLQWITILTTWDAYQKRGRNPQDPLIVDLKDDRARVLAEVLEASNSKDGLYDLPVSEDLDSAVTTGGPLFYSESSPFVSADRQEAEGRLEDARGFGTMGGH